MRFAMVAVVGGVLLQAGAAPASTPMVVVQGADLQAATAAVSTPVDMVRAQLADRGVNSSTHGHVANDADIAEELKALGGHVGRLVSRLMNRAERSEEAQATQQRL